MNSKNYQLSELLLRSNLFDLFEPEIALPLSKRSNYGLFYGQNLMSFLDFNLVLIVEKD